jgi:hypothetical protein
MFIVFFLVNGLICFSLNIFPAAIISSLEAPPNQSLKKSKYTLSVSFGVALPTIYNALSIIDVKYNVGPFGQ